MGHAPSPRSLARGSGCSLLLVWVLCADSIRESGESIVVGGQKADGQRRSRSVVAGRPRRSLDYSGSTMPQPSMTPCAQPSAIAEEFESPWRAAHMDWYSRRRYRLVSSRVIPFVSWKESTWSHNSNCWVSSNPWTRPTSKSATSLGPRAQAVTAMRRSRGSPRRTHTTPKLLRWRSRATPTSMRVRIRDTRGPARFTLQGRASPRSRCGACRRDRGRDG